MRKELKVRPNDKDVGKYNQIIGQNLMVEEILNRLQIPFNPSKYWRTN